MGPRKHFLDWLRVGAFGLLILFHVGLLYVSWDFNLKSPRLVPAAEPWLLAFSVWRMPLLFLISGVACAFLAGKQGPGGFARDRLRRLVPVILFGMLVVIPPQTYVMLLSRGLISQGYFDFWWGSYLRADQTLVAPLGRTMPTWDHLWFLVYLLVYSVGLALVLVLARAARLPPLRLPVPVLVAGPAVWLVASNLLTERYAPLTHDLVGDWGGHIKWIGLFAAGALAAHQSAFWAWLRDQRRILTLVALILLAAQTLSSGLAWTAVSGLYGWAAICAIAGYAAAHLDRRSGLLSHLNEAVLPVYVLHQPILLVAAFLVFPLRLPLAVEALFLTAITIGGAFAIYEVAIRPLAPVRFLFGLKTEKQPEAQPQAA